jgi:hypothetical protein
MSYSRHYKLVDDVTQHFDEVTKSIDPFIESRYVGFFAVASISVIELAYRDIIVDFATRAHPTFGTFFTSHYKRLNARVKLEHIEDDLRRLGGPFKPRFSKLLNRVHAYEIRRNSFSVKDAYSSLITCRHKFSHEGSVPENIGYIDVKNGYRAGQIVLACLAKALK